MCFNLRFMLVWQLQLVKGIPLKPIAVAARAIPVTYHRYFTSTAIGERDFPEANCGWLLVPSQNLATSALRDKPRFQSCVQHLKFTSDYTM